MLKKLISISAFGLAISIPAAFASSIGNNGATASVSVSSGFVGTQVADTGNLSFTSSSFTSGVVDQRVYRESTGTLDFYYLISNNAYPTSKDNIGRVTTTDFTGFTTNVSYLAGTGTAPTSADRSTYGDTVGFDFQVNNGNILAPGTSSDWLEISTNATSFALIGGTNAIDGGTGSVVTYAPTAVPEPMSMSLMGAGLAGFGLLGLRRRSAKK